MTFSEEFNGALDLSKWKRYLWYQPEEDQYNNFEISSGSLKIWNVRNNGGGWVDGRAFNTDGDSNAESSDPQYKFAQRHGFFEIGCRLPVGVGNWPSFWLLGRRGSTRPEVDIFECFSGNEGFFRPSDFHPVMIQSTIHRGTSGSTVSSGNVKSPRTLDLSAGINKIGCKWDLSGFEFYLNGVSYGRVNETGINEPLFLIVAMGTTTGRTWNGLTYPEPNQNSSLSSANPYLIDYVKCWGLPDNSHQVVGTATNRT